MELVANKSQPKFQQTSMAEPCPCRVGAKMLLVSQSVCLWHMVQVSVCYLQTHLMAPVQVQ